jgi:hypothetical protein
MNMPPILETFRKIAAAADSEWIRRKRKVNTETLVMEIARGKSNRLGLRQMSAQGSLGFSASALVQAKQRIPVNVLSKVLHQLNSTMSTGRRVVAVDSSKVSLPMRFIAQCVMPRNEAAKKPLIMCSTLFDVKLDVPLDVIVASHHNERSCLTDEHAPVLRAGDLVVGDRGYYSRDVCVQLKTQGIDTLLRVKEKACKQVMLFVASRRNNRIVNIDGLRVKCFKYTFRQQRYVLLSTDLALSLSTARTLYKARWRIEEGFRRWKSDFNICRHMAHSLHTFKIDVLSVAIAHLVVRESLQARVMRNEPDQKSMPLMNAYYVRAFRACALALFPLLFDAPWQATGIWIPTRRARI